MSEFAEFAVDERAETVEPSPERGTRRHSHVDVVMPTAAIAVVATAFLPWVVVRLPGQSSSTFSLVELTGGRFLVALAASLCVIGQVVIFKLRAIGTTMLVVGVALIGWLAGIGLLALGFLRGLLPSLSVLGIDLSRSLLGPSYGVFLAFAGVNLIGIHIFATSKASKRTESRLSLLLLAASLLQLALHQMVWAVADFGDISDRIIITGDSLFGNLLVTVAAWCAVVLSALGFLRSHQLAVRLSAIALLIASTTQLLQTIVMWSGRGLLRLLLPSRIDDAASLELRWVMYVSALTALGGVVLGVFMVVTGDRPVGRLTIGYLVPALVGTHGLVVALLLVATAVTRESNIPTPSANSLSPTTTAVAATPSPTTSPTATTTTQQPSIAKPTDTLLGAVVNVTLGRPGAECSGGSGVIIGDGTYVLTNEHVISPEPGDPAYCETPYVGITTDPTSPPSQVFEAQILEADPDRDLALLRILNVEASALPTLAPRYELLPIDASVRLIGYPGVGGETVTQTRGQVAGYLDDPGGRLYKIDIVSNRGNSGGPLVDEAGSLVGILTFATGNPVDCSAGQCESIGANLALVRTISAAKDLIERAGG
jgi:S1-C subfamily serine protease